MKYFCQYLCLLLLSSYLAFPAAAQIRFTSLQEVWTYANSHNIQLQTTVAQQTAAGIGVKQAYGNLLPGITASGGFTDNITIQSTLIPAHLFNPAVPEGSFSEVTFGRRYMYTGNIQAQFDLLNTQDWFSVKAAKLQQEIASLNISQTRKALYEQLAGAWFTYLLLDEAEQLSRNNLLATATMYLLAQDKFNDGAVSEVTLNTALINKEKADKSLEVAVQNKQVQCNNLRLLLHLSDSIVIAPAPAPATVHTDTAAFARDPAVRMAYTQRRIVCSLPALLFAGSCHQPRVTIMHPVVAPITEAVFAPGTVEAGDQFTLTALYDGYITEMPVQEGDEVHTGQLLYRQDNSAAMIQEQAASENLAIAREQASDHSAVLEQLNAQLLSARQQLQTDQAQLERMTRLYTSRSVAKVDLENAQLAYDNAVNNVNNLQQNIAATKLTLQQSVINSRSQQQTAAVNAGYYQLKSPGHYTIYSLLKRRGDLVKKGEAVAVLGNQKALTLVLNIDEASITKIKLNQRVLVELNTEKGKTYTATLSKMYPLFDGPSQSYKVEARFDSTATHIINGTLLQANIIVAQKDNALLIPRNCLTLDGKVMRQQGKHTDTIAVQTGIVASDWVEVLHGVHPNDQLIKAW